MCFRNYGNKFCSLLPSSFADTKYYNLNTNTIVLKKEEYFHVLKLREGNGFVTHVIPFAIRNTIVNIITPK